MAIHITTTLGSTDISIGKVGHGLMMMTARSAPLPDDDLFDAIKSGMDHLPPNTKMLLDSAEFYGLPPNLLANLELVSRFFEKYPEYTDRAFLMVKGALQPDFQPDCRPETIRNSVETVLKALRGKKKIDAYQCARVDPKVPYEESIACLAELVKEGKFDYIGVSETTAATLRKAHAIHPILAVQIEVSPWSYEEKTKDVIATAKELGVTVLGYSPIGRGFLTGTIRTVADLDPKDIRRRHPRFQPENMAKNLELVHALEKQAAERGVTAAQLAIAWVSSLGPHVVPIPGSSNKKRTIENIEGGDVVLSTAEKKEIDGIVESFEVSGHRYPEMAQDVLWG